MAPPVVKRERPVTRAPRADAARNRERILATALEMFASHGVGTSVEEIAKRADVGIGTLYRHFPTKDALVAAAVIDRFDAMAAHAETLSAAPDAGAALVTVLEQLVLHAASKKDFVDALGGPEKFMRTVDVPKKRWRAAIAVLVTRAQEAGAVRRDVTPDDVIALARGISMTGGDAPTRARHLAIVLAGLRA